MPILKPESYNLCENGRKHVPTKLLTLFTSRPPTATLPVVLLSNFRTRDVCHDNVWNPTESLLSFFWHFYFFYPMLGIHHRVNCKKLYGIHRESKLILANCVFLWVPHVCEWKFVMARFLRVSYFNIIWNKMIACTRSSPKKLTNTIHHEIRRAIQPLHLFMTFTFCVTHTFPLLFSWGPCVRLSMNSRS